uniref:Uncharacterized protein n=1 Tax=Bionectria ochroleuca TaxID=29856 RepID=A0A0B7KH08_BIOOC
MFLKRIGFASSVFLAQYVSEKFKWDLHETTWLRVFRSGGAILVYIITPILNRRLVNRGNLPHLAELNIIRGSLLVLAVSFFGSWSVHRGWFMLAVIALADAAAELIAGPLMAALMNIGRTPSHPSDGLCFLASSILFVLLFIWAFLFKIPDNR